MVRGCNRRRGFAGRMFASWRSGLVDLAQRVRFGRSFHCLDVVELILQRWRTRTTVIGTIANAAHCFCVQHLAGLQRRETVRNGSG